MTIPAITGVVSTGVSVLNSFGLGSVDPQKEAERLATIDTLKRDAIQVGTKTSRPYIQLACWAGASMTSPEYQLAVSYGIVSPGQVCRVGSDSALVYAKAAKLAVDAALLVSGVVKPIITDVAVEHVKVQVMAALPYVIGAVALVLLVVYLRKKGR